MKGGYLMIDLTKPASEVYSIIKNAYFIEKPVMVKTPAGEVVYSRVNGERDLTTGKLRYSVIADEGYRYTRYRISETAIESFVSEYEAPSITVDVSAFTASGEETDTIIYSSDDDDDIETFIALIAKIDALTQTQLTDVFALRYRSFVMNIKGDESNGYVVPTEDGYEYDTAEITVSHFKFSQTTTSKTVSMNAILPYTGNSYSVVKITLTYTEDTSCSLTIKVLTERTISE